MKLQKNELIEIVIGICIVAILFGLIGTAIYREATAKHEEKVINMTIDHVVYNPAYVEVNDYRDNDGNIRTRVKQHNADYYTYFMYDGKLYLLNNAEEYYYCKDKIGRKVDVCVTWVEFKNGDITIRPHSVVRE